MIIQLTETYLNDLTESEVSDLYYNVVRNCHYISCDNLALTVLTGAIEHCGSRSQKQLIKSAKQGHLTAELRRYLTTIQANLFTYGELMTIVTKPSCLMIENLANESDVYRSIIGTYAGDPKFRNLFMKLDDAKRRGWLTFLHAGGFGDMKPLLDYYDSHDYENVADKKIGVLMDRDTENGNTFPSKRQNLFSMLSGKSATTLTNADIYTLSTGPYVWHMWHKRAIENYFPPLQFDRLGFPSSTAPILPADWSYKELGKITHYKKSRLPELREGMSRSDYENNCSQFPIIGGSVSEIQLLLLKLVKLI